MQGPKKTSVWFDTVPDARRFPALAGSHTADVAVIGGGILGVTTAWHLIREGFSVVLLEKNHIATGDTGLTTGFLTRAHDFFTHPRRSVDAASVRRAYAIVSTAQTRLFSFIRENNVACDFATCNSYIGSYTANDKRLAERFTVLQQLDPSATIVTKREIGAPFPFVQAIRMTHEGRFNARKFVFALLERSKTDGNLSIFEETEITDIQVNDTVTIRAATGSLSARMLIVTTGKTPSQFPELRTLIENKLSYVICGRFARRPLSPDLFWDINLPYFYLRTVDENTVMVGDYDRSPHEKPSHDPFEGLATFLRKKLGGAFEVTHQWSGSLWYTSDGFPYVFAHPAYPGKVFMGCGLGGDGIVMSFIMGEALSALAARKRHGAHDFLSLTRTGATVVGPQRSSHEASAGFVAVASTADFKDTNTLCRTVSGKKIALFKVGNKYYALDNECTHEEGPLCEGVLDGKVIECPLHFAKFDVTTGEVLAPPAVRSERTYPVRLSGDSIEVSLTGGKGNTGEPQS